MSGINPTDNKRPGEEQDSAATDYKAKLDEAAERVKNPQSESNENSGKGNIVTEKVSQFVSTVGGMLGKDEEHSEGGKRKTSSPPPIVDGPKPMRPEHDTQIEEFVRDQHRSKPVTGSEE